MLFDLSEDPEEFNDLASDPAHAQVRERLLEKVQRGWDGGWIQQKVTRKRKQYTPLLHQWGETNGPPHPDYWQGTNDMNQFTPC